MPFSIFMENMAEERNYQQQFLVNDQSNSHTLIQCNTKKKKS
jgi:hypothetical protein